MNMLQVKFLPSTAKNEEDSSAVDLRSAFEAIVEGKGKLVKFEVSSGIAYLTIQGDEAKNAVRAELEKENAEVKEVSALSRQHERNKKRQKKSDEAVMRHKKDKGKTGEAGEVS